MVHNRFIINILNVNMSSCHCIRHSIPKQTIPRSICTCVPNVGHGPMVMSEKRGYRQTDTHTHTHKGTLQLYIVDLCVILLIYFEYIKHLMNFFNHFVLTRTALSKFANTSMMRLLANAS